MLQQHRLAVGLREFKWSVSTYHVTGIEEPVFEGLEELTILMHYLKADDVVVFDSRLKELLFFSSLENCEETEDAIRPTFPINASKTAIRNGHTYSYPDHLVVLRRLKSIPPPTSMSENMDPSCKHVMDLSG